MMTQDQDQTDVLAQELVAPMIKAFREQQKRSGNLRDHQRDQKITRGAEKIYTLVARFKA